MKNIKFLSGNEAVAAGAYRAGCAVAAAYPGTPSTEILEAVAKFKGRINCEWSVNEKVAAEVAIGASIAGVRSLAAMKHVGLNVAMDPLMTYTYIGTNGGMAVVVADDPGMHSSQNEQDSRILVKFAKTAQFEPSDSQEAYDMTREAFELSERTGSIVFIRLTTRTSHSSSLVDLGDDYDYGPAVSRGYKKDVAKNVSVPANARIMRFKAEKRLELLLAEAEKSRFNRVFNVEGSEIGIVTSAVACEYVREVFPDCSILKLGFTNPLPAGVVGKFAAGVKRLYVVEELDHVLRDAIICAGFKVENYSTELSMLELNPDRLLELRREILGGAAAPVPRKLPDWVPPLPSRPPALCAGCPHRGVFYTLAKLGATVSGDIGCYTLGSAPPLAAMDTAICMGASIGAAFGMAKAGLKGRLAAVIGDSTFFHSGMTGLLDVVYNKGGITVVVLDNRITAMTGGQHNPGSGKTLLGDSTVQTSIAEVARALGVKRVREVSAYDMTALETTLKEELDITDEPSVVVVFGPCILASKRSVGATPDRIDPDKCRSCGACFKLGCPAIIRGENIGGKFKADIDPAMCIGCGICSQVCKFGAIKSGKAAE